MKHANRKRKIQKVEAIQDEAVYVRQMSGRHFAQIADLMHDVDPEAETGKSIEGLGAIVARCACNAEGDLMFENVEEAMEETFDFLQAVGEVAMEVNGLTEEDDGDPKD